MKRLGELMSDPRVGDTRLWHRDIPYLVAGLNLGPYLYVYGPYNRYNLHKQGYMILGRDTLVEMWDAVGGQVRAQMASYLGSVARSVSVEGEEFVSYLLGHRGKFVAADPWSCGLSGQRG